MNEIIKSPVFNELAETQIIKKADIIANAKSVIPAEMSAKEMIDLCTRITGGELYLKTIKDEIRKRITEADVKLTGNLLGADINYGATKTDYDYESDITYNSLKSQLKAREELLKNQRKLYDKHIESGAQTEFTGIVEDGEQLPVVNKTVTSGVKITLK